MFTLLIILIVILGLLICFCILLAITLTLYWIPKKLGSHVLGVIFASIFASTFVIGLLFFIVGLVYDEVFFTKGDARKLLQAQQIELHERFKILRYRHQFAFGDFSKTLILKIDPADKKRLITEITNTASFQEVDSSAVLSPLYTNTDRYFGPYLERRYKAGELYYIESYKRSQKKNVAPLYVKIIINSGDTLQYKHTEY